MCHLNIEIEARVDDLAPFRHQPDALSVMHTGTDM